MTRDELRRHNAALLRITAQAVALLCEVEAMRTVDTSTCDEDIARANEAAKRASEIRAHLLLVCQPVTEGVAPPLPGRVVTGDVIEQAWNDEKRSMDPTPTKRKAPPPLPSPHDYEINGPAPDLMAMARASLVQPADPRLPKEREDEEP